MKPFKIAVFLILSFSAAIVMAQGDGLIHHYKFDGDIKDAVGEAHGKILEGKAGATAVFVKGHDDTENGAVSFPTRDKAWYIVEVGTWSPSQLGTKDELTVAFWAFWRGSTGGPQDIINKRDSWKENDLVWGINQHGFTGDILSVHRPGNPKSYANSKKGIPLEKWTHVAISMDNKNAYFYMDGELYDEQPFTYGSDFEAMIRIGNSANNNSPNVKDIYNGALDDVRFYSRKLTDDEVKQILSPPVDVKPAQKPAMGKGAISLQLLSNPGGRSIQINGLAGSATVSVMDLKGNLLVKEVVASNGAIAADALSQGLYIVKVEDAQGFTDIVHFISE